MTASRALLLLLISLVFSPIPKTAAQNSETLPYIYYLANPVHALVIERADGSDSRIIAPGAMPDDHTVIADLDWSPSGEWVAWRSALTLLDDLGGAVVAMRWSPTADMLFVAQSEDRNLTLMIIDVPNGKIIAQADYQTSSWVPNWYEGLFSGWLADGSIAYFILAVSDAQLLGQLTISNQLTTNLFSQAYASIVNMQNGRMFYYAAHEKDPGLNLVMKDLVTGKQIIFDTEQRPKTTYQVYWNTGMEYALIFSRSCGPTTCVPTQLYLMNWAEGKFQWVGDHYQPGETDYLAGYRNYDDSLWSPNGGYALLRAENGTGLSLLDAVSNRTFPITIPGISEDLDWQWIADTHSIILHPKTQTDLYQYDLSSKTITKLSFDMPDTYSGFSISPDGRYLGLRWHTTDEDAVDLETGKQWNWPHHSLGASAGPILSYLWSQDSYWFMTGEMSAFASGGTGPSAVTILNTDGSVRRELSVCWSLGGCAGFVPQRVIPHLKTGSPHSVIQEPEFTLTHPGKVDGVSWSPDGTKLASYSVNNDTYAGYLNIWDMSGIPQQIAAYQTTISLGSYPNPSRLLWSADGKFVTVSNWEAQETWDIAAGKPVPPEATSDVSVNAYAVLSPDGKLVIRRDDTGRDVSIADTGTDTIVAHFSFDEQTYWVGWSSDSQSAFIENPPGRLKIWNMNKLQTLDGKRSSVFSADYHFGGRYIVGGSLYTAIHIWDADTGKQLRDLNWYATGLALSPDGTKLAAAGTRLVTIWDTSQFDQQQKEP